MTTTATSSATGPRPVTARRPAALPARVWLLLPAAVCLMGGLDAGLVLLGVPAPIPSSRLGDVHGPVMVLGFLGAVIALERATALRARWGYTAAGLLGLGGALLLSPAPRSVGQVMLLDGCAALVAVLVALWRRRRDDAVLVEVLAGCLAVMAALLWVRVDAAVVVPMLSGFIVLTIAAERVELSRVHLPARAGAVLVALASAVTLAATLAPLVPQVGARLFGVALMALVVWLAPRDVAVRMVHARGLPRFAASAMLLGYGWLALAATAWTAAGATHDIRVYDVLVHAVFLGFAMSMVLAHLPVILPAVVRRAVPYRRALWAPLALLHAALALRVAGDLADVPELVRVGGTGTAAALATLPLVALGSAALSSRRTAAHPPTPGKSTGDSDSSVRARRTVTSRVP